MPDAPAAACGPPNFRYSLHQGYAPWLHQLSNSEEHLIRSLHAQLYRLWSGVKRERADLMPSHFCLAANPLGEDAVSGYVRMRTHGNIWVAYAYNIRDGTYTIRAPFQKVHYSRLGQVYGCANCGGCWCLRAQVFRTCGVCRMRGAGEANPTTAQTKSEAG